MAKSRLLITDAMLVTAQRILIGGIVGLFPMLVYCLLLIGINGRRRANGCGDFPKPKCWNVRWNLAGVSARN